MLYRLGLVMVRFRWVVVALWALALVVALIYAPKASSSLKGGFGSADVESRRGLTILEERLGLSEAVLTLVFSSQDPELRATDSAFIQEMEETMFPLAQDPRVTRIVTHYNSGDPHMVSSDSRAAYSLVLLDTSIDEALDHYSELRRLLQPERLDLLVTGGIAIFADLNEASARDLNRAEVIAFPLVLVALVLIFGSVIAAGLPVLIGGISIALTLAMVYGISQVTDVSIFVLNIATFLGLGIAIDYSLLVVSRFREELVHRPREEAVGVTLAMAGRALFFSGLTTILGLSGLLFMDFMMLRSVGIGGILVVAISLLLALTLLPAVLGILGPRVSALAIIPIRPEGEGLWRRIATAVMRRPFWVILPVVLLLVLLGGPFLRVNLGTPWASILPIQAEARRGWELLEERFGVGEASPILLVVTAPEPILGDSETIGRLYDYAHALKRDPRVARVESIVTLQPGTSKAQYQRFYAEPDSILFPEIRGAIQDLVQGDTTLLRLFERNPPLSEESKELVRHIRATAPGDGLELYVTGPTADIMDSVEVMYQDFPWVVIYVMGAVFLVLFWLFRSLVLPLKAIIMNAMSIFASYGALVYIFQEGHFQELLGFTAQGHIEATIPILMFCILFGLSMDYEVFLLSRVQEFYETTRDNAASVALGLSRTGRVITSAALILVLVAAAFATAEIVFVKALGVGMAVAIFLDATIVRALLVPALMRVLGRWNWWAPALFRKRASKMVG